MANLSWDPVPGATGYEVYKTPSPDTDFGDTPVATVGGGQTRASVSGIPSGSFPWFAVRTLTSSGGSMIHPLVQAAPAVGPTAAEQGSSPNHAEQATTCSSPRPVNCATGTFWHTFTDAAIRGLGPALDFTRTYRSSDANTDGPIGYGWTDSYSIRLSLDQSGNAVVSQEDGAQVSFTSNGSGGFTAPARVLATLTANNDGTYTFTRFADRVRYVFSGQGQLVREVDRNGYQTTLSYDSNWNVTTVTDQAGRSLAHSRLRRINMSRA